MNSKLQSPFDLNNDEAYQDWRKGKLANANTYDKYSFINIKKTPPHFYGVSPDCFPSEVSNSEIKALLPIDQILLECHHNNYCLYKLEECQNLDAQQTKRFIHALANACGINQLDNNLCADEDSLTSLYNKKCKDKREYIPYTNKKLSWHTDGYYNTKDQTIFSMLLHCYNNAEDGGESAFIDHEIVYILLRDQNPRWIAALSNNEVMTIPANILNNKIIREQQTGPVFSVSPQGQLHMRYSARLRNIIWHQDTDTQDALAFLQELLDLTRPSLNTDFIVKHKFKAGEGIISRNILHCRNAFQDNDTSIQQRLLFRGRFYDELSNDTIALTI